MELTDDTRGELAALRMETEILWPERCAALDGLLERSLELLDKATQHRAMARIQNRDRFRLVADQLWEDHIQQVQALREKWAAVAQK